MRYFAILKDSFREARDSKVMYVLIVLSTLAIIGVGTLSFKPLSAKSAYEQFFPNPKLGGISMMFVALNHAEINKSNLDEDDFKAKGDAGGHDVLERLQLLNEYRLEKTDLLNGEPDAPESDYVLTLAETFPRFGQDGDQDKLIETGKARVRKIFGKAEELEFIKIGDIVGEVEKQEAPLPPRVRYRVTIHGTSQTFRIWAHEPSLFFGSVPLEAVSMPLGYQLYVLAKNVLAIGAWAAILVAVIITSFFIPNMLTKGTIDSMLVKPVDRWSLLLYKYIGGLTFIFLVNSYTMVGMWMVLGIRTGLWPHLLLLLIPTLTFFFAILYAISTLVSVATRSIIATIIVTIIFWVLFVAIGTTDNIFRNLARNESRLALREKREVEPEKSWKASNMAKAASLLHAVTPRTEELNSINDQIIFAAFMTGTLSFEKFTFGERPWWESMLVASVWIAVFLTLSCAWFWMKDY